ncbi:hypothetical protein C0J52_18958 [Blattella germanica]|nr:hypothetical protein C0J52_18958 [Blattella germanica]
MARLCTQMNSLLQETVLKRLQQWNVFTVVDLLQEDSEKLVQITKLSYKSSDEFLAIKTNKFKVMNVKVHLDTMLEGGLLTGKIYEICGASGSGKTQLCLTISSNFAHDFKQQLHYIDTKKDFSGKRIQEMLEAKHCSDEIIGALMEKIQVTRIENIYELFSFLHHLKNTLQNEQDDQHSVRVIIIDSVSVLFFPFLGEKDNDATHWIEDDNTPVDKSLETSVQEENSNSTDVMRPAIGKSWLDVPCTRLMINKPNSEETRQITVMKSTYLKTGKQCKVLINSKGIVSQ